MPRIAVLIDADNISAKHAHQIFSQAATLGTPVIRRIFGRPSAMVDWQEAARAAVCETRGLLPGRSAKNGTDIALAVDAMDILHAGGLQAFCIVSNDRDFMPLANRLRAAGRPVHAICKQGDPWMAKAFDSVFELEPARKESPIVDAFCQLTADRGHEMSLGEAGKLLRKHLPGVIPTSGKAPLRKALESTGRFALSGNGSAIRVKLVG